MRTETPVDATVPPQGESSGGWHLSRGSREVRLGLVVYGGVSLAIYINGVAQELFNCVRGRGIYALLKRLLDCDIVADIVSGTSAGGINGVLLAFALVNDREFSESAKLWRDQGSLAKLLRLVDDEVNATSLLDSRNYYLPELERALRSMPKVKSEVEARERRSTFDELDLFVTGTNYDGQISTAIDATGRHIEVKNHRTVFHLKHRARRKEPFTFPERQGDRPLEERARVAALARLCAITSCFPVAFEPVRVGPGQPNTLEDRVYRLLCEWGALDERTETWFLDGGVLDNKPFSYTIQEIFNRTASRPVERKLFYVEPDPERFKTGLRPARTEPPDVVHSALQALVGIPGYESIADDLAQIARRNDRLQRLTRAREAAERAWSTEESSGDTSIIPASVLAIYRHTRLAQISTRAIAGLMAHEGFRRPAHEPDASPSQRDQDVRTVAALARAFEDWPGSADETLRRYDVYVRRRRLFHVIYRVFAHVTGLCQGDSTEASLDKAQSLKMVWQVLNQHLSVYDVLQWAMESALDRYPLPRNTGTELAAPMVWTELAGALDRVLYVDSESAEACKRMAFSELDLKALHGRLKLRFQPGAQAPSVIAPIAGGSTVPNLLQCVDEQTERFIAAVSAEHPEIAAAWRHFERYDAHFFPVDYFGDLGEKDQIDVVRVSPLDAERAFSRRAFEDKITGETVMHFGAFLKRSWRANDIMWGRLDGACRILDALLTRDTLRRSVANPEVRQLLRVDIEEDLAPARVFPHVGPKIQAQLRAWLQDLASDIEATRSDAVENQTQHDLLLWCAQLEILHENLPVVLEDAIVEQLEWNSLRAEHGFRSMGVRINPPTARIVGVQATRDFIKSLGDPPSDTDAIENAPIAQYFLKHYTVGAETPAKDIPPAVLLETLTAASLVANNCVLNALPEQGRTLRSNLLYRVLIAWPLTTAHALAVLARRERVFFFGALAVLFTYALLALGGGVLWLRTDLKAEEELYTLRIVFLIVLPMVILLAGGYAAWLYTLRHVGRSALAVASLFALCCLSLAAGLPIVFAFAAAWPATNAKLSEWFSDIPYLPLRDTAALRLYPLAALVTVLVVLVPLARGFIQARMARRSAGFFVEDQLAPAWNKSIRLARESVDAAVSATRKRVSSEIRREPPATSSGPGAPPQR